VLAAETGNLAAHPDMPELVLDRAPHRLGDLGDGEFGGVGEAHGHGPEVRHDGESVKGDALLHPC
jgi:hypothetical protein